MVKNNKLLRLFLLFSLCFLASLQTIEAQIDQGSHPDSLKALSQNDSLQNSLPDTILVTYYYQGKEHTVYNYADTSLNSRFHQYDPLRRHTFGGLHLGNTGSPATLLYLNPFRPVGMDWGFHQFDLYNNTVDSLPFYGLGRAITDAYFSFRGQSNSVFYANFARQFQDGFQFTLKYSKINQLGQFLSQKAVISSLATGIAYRNPKNKYRFYLSMSSNNSRVSENGGLTTDSLFFEDEFSTTETQPIYLTSAQTHQLNRRYQFYQFYKMGHSENGNYLEWKHKSWYEKGFYKFFDNNVPLDSTYYGRFLTDGRGVRQYFSGTELGTELGLSFMGYTKDQQSIEWLPTPGIKVVKYAINQEPISHTATHVSLTGKWNVTLKKVFELSAKADLGLIGYSGDYLLNGQMKINTKKVGIWTLLADFQAVTPSLLTQNSFVTQNLVWENNFEKEFVNRVGARYELPKFRFSFGGQFSLLTNHIYFDTSGRAAQELTTFPVLQLSARKDIRVKGFNLNSKFLYHEIGSDVIRRPSIYLDEQLFWKGDLFSNALRLKIGVDYRFYSSWQPNTYLPVVGQFVLQDDFIMSNISTFDVFADFKVSTFRFFAKMENLQYYWDERVFYQVADYPQFKPNFRMGIGWIFRD